ncbi:MAG: hypothetical protein ACFFE8_04230, partial [Candidatus Heimdallarchaeota archaeon]
MVYEIEYLKKTFKSHNITTRRVWKAAVSVFIVILMFSSSISASAYRAEITKAAETQQNRRVFSYDLDKRIVVLYPGDANSVISGTAFSLFNSLRTVYKSIDIIPVGSLDEIRKLDFNSYNIIIYIFSTSVEGVNIGNLVPWKD